MNRNTHSVSGSVLPRTKLKLSHFGFYECIQQHQHQQHDFNRHSSCFMCFQRHFSFNIVPVQVTTTTASRQNTCFLQRCTCCKCIYLIVRQPNKEEIIVKSVHSFRSKWPSWIFLLICKTCIIINIKYHGNGVRCRFIASFSRDRLRLSFALRFHCDSCRRVCVVEGLAIVKIELEWKIWKL